MSRGRAVTTRVLDRAYPLRLPKAVRAAIPLVSIVIVASPGIAGQPFPAVFELSALNGEDGFSVDGIAENDVAGASVSAGTDINGDEIADLLIGAIGVDPEGLNGVGATYIVYGGASVGASGHVDLSTLNGITGCALYGLNEGDFSGSVSGVGDFNRDGFADVLIGASGGDPNRRFEAGQGYLVYGGPQIGVGGEFELADLNGLNGFNLNATHLLGHLGDGGSLSGVGDVNGDGYADVAIGAKWADPAGRADAGQSYVVFGGPTVGVDGNLLLTTLNGHNGFTLNGIAPGDNAGIALGYGGDVNGDGFSDLVVGAVNADPGGRDDAGQTYVVFGNSVPFPAQLELSSLDGSQGFAINGIQRLDHSGVVVNNVGDVNADGHEDIAIGAWRASPQGVFDAGQSYVIFGGPDIGASGTIELSDLNGSNGFMLDGVAEGDQSGSVASGRLDLNHDGVADLIIGAHRADPGGRTDAGSTYVVYGKAGLGASGLIELSELNGEDGFVLNGVTEEDFSAATAAPGGDLNNDGIDDLIIGAFNADPHAIEDAGQTYVVFGRAGDSDDDGIANNVDNCTKIANSDQRDSNSDGYGNACDPDLDNNGVTNFTDLGLLKAAFFGADPDADLTGDGQVNFGDLGVMKSLFLMPPGPSGFVE